MTTTQTIPPTRWTSAAADITPSSIARSAAAAVARPLPSEARSAACRVRSSCQRSLSMGDAARSTSTPRLVAYYEVSIVVFGRNRCKDVVAWSSLDAIKADDNGDVVKLLSSSASTTDETNIRTVPLGSSTARGVRRR